MTMKKCPACGAETSRERGVAVAHGKMSTKRTKASPRGMTTYRTERPVVFDACSRCEWVQEVE